KAVGAESGLALSAWSRAPTVGSSAATSISVPMLAATAISPVAIWLVMASTMLRTMFAWIGAAGLAYTSMLTGWMLPSPVVKSGVARAVKSAGMMIAAA